MAAMARRVKSQTGKSAVLLGYGYVARALAPLLLKAGYTVFATRRKPETHMRLIDGGRITMLPFTGSPNDDLQAALNEADIVLSSISPIYREDGDSEDGDSGDHVAAVVAEYANPDWVGYLSATSVFGDRKGQWVFEDELLYLTTDRGRRRIEAELTWLDTGLPVHVFRLAGIYGPLKDGVTRNPFARLAAGKARAVIKPDHVVNRLHVDDIASAVMASIERPNGARVYNIADGHPSPPQDVLDFAASLLGCEPPVRVTPDDPGLSEMAKNFYSETKRVNADRARRELGWEPRYPTYRDGLIDIYNRDFQ